MIAAVVVLYNPEKGILKNICAYIDFVDKVYIIDNSSLSNENLFKEFPVLHKLEYFFNNGNLGIAKALNIGCRLAIKSGFKWVLTMDQDSEFKQLKESVKMDILNCKDKKNALYYPNYQIEGFIYDKYIKENGEPIVVMTSGNIINLDVYNELNGFEDKLFIDYVDIDYCLKLKQAGYKIVNLPEVILAHELGKSKHISFFNFKIIVTNHSSLRRYYITRNRLYVRNKYKNFSTIFNNIERKVFMNDILKIIFFEQNKFLKIKSVIKGYIDYRHNKYGVYN
ncbi:glycosyltransferase family 2 protein [Flavobacterium aquariorum]|uniref:Glycosyltransferase family 2 protein n=1 Tax=Flavobacterium aquariorum TaxID=2217670 RepID=A0A2W7VJL9_9FLAO|nr:glycosyltransferase family 2 protein [Flavobacterium aquariorum]PZX92482.1 glycosyltransferase family 2 protein [Flavobacterium aquariorum]